MINEILGVVSDYGFPAVIVGIIVFILWKALPYLLKNKFQNFSLLGSRKDDGVNELKYHPFFNSAEYRMTVEIPALDLMPSKPVKQQMFRDLIFIETKIIYDSCTEIIKIDMTEWTAEQWVTEITNHVNKMINTVLKKAREEGVPDIALLKYSKWHADTYEMLFDHIRTLGSASVYPDNVTRTNTLLIIMGFMLVVTISDAERSLKELNGELAGKLYKSMPIES